MQLSSFIKSIAVVLLSGSLLLGCSDDDDSTAGGSSGALPAAVSGQIISFIYQAINPGSPFNDGDTVRFTFSSSGTLMIDSNGDGLDDLTISGFTQSGSEYIWEDAGAGFKYALSLKPDGSVNEVNVSTDADAFLGQFTPVSTSGGAGTNACASGTAGQYCLTVTVLTISTEVGPVAAVPSQTEMEATVKTDYEQGGATVSGITLTKTVDTAAQETWKADFTLTTGGGGVSYSVIYDFVQI